jgi:hypothetical protein
MERRRFPPPWSVEELEACFVVRDHNGQQLAYVYFEDEPGRKMAAKLLTRDEAQRSKKQQTTRQEVEQSLLGLDSRNGPSQILRAPRKRKKGCHRMA